MLLSVHSGSKEQNRWEGARLEIRRVRQLLQLPIKEIMVNRTKTVAEETESNRFARNLENRNKRSWRLKVGGEKEGVKYDFLVSGSDPW